MLVIPCFGKGITMTSDERALLIETAKFTHYLSQNRNDMLVGVTAALLDLYREDFKNGTDTKTAALARLRLQREQLASVGGVGTEFLQYLMGSLEADKLDAAKLYRDVPAGSA
jgi:hypothetical protein